MENAKKMDKGALNLYDIYKESYEISSRVKAVYDKQKQLSDELFEYCNHNFVNRKNFEEVESVLGLKENLSFFFYKFIPFVIQNYLLKNQNSIKSLDANEYKISTNFRLSYKTSIYKHISYEDENIEFPLPYDSDYYHFEEILIKFIEELNLGTIKMLNSQFGLDYSILIETSLQDLIYACYLGEELVKVLEDECIDLLSDYFSEEQLANFKKTLHR